MKIVGISGSLSSPSRTRSLVEAIAHRIAHKFPAAVEIIDIAEIGASVGATVSYDNIPEVVSAAFKKLHEADVIVIGTPVYKASYTGLLKHFFDLIDYKALVGKVAVLAATGGSDQHASVLDYQLRPLANFFGIYTIPVGIYAKDTDFIDYQLSNDAISARIDTAANQAVELLSKEKQVAYAA